MKFYTFGQKENPAIMLLPGTCCHWKRNFEEVIPYLEKDYYVVCVSYDGFDETEDTIFPDMIVEAERIEAYVKMNLNGRIHAVYGCSMGGSFVGLLVQRKEIHISHGILGSSDLDQEVGMSAKFKAWLIARVLHGVFRKGKLPGFFQRRLEQKDPEQRAYMAKMLKMYLERYRQHFENPNICGQDMYHEELLLCYPEKWAAEVKRVTTEY